MGIWGVGGRMVEERRDHSGLLVSRGQPTDWLTKSDCHALSDLCYLEMGLGRQSLHMEFESPKASYNLLIRNQHRCDQFLQCLTCKSFGAEGSWGMEQGGGEWGAALVLQAGGLPSWQEAAAGQGW